MLPLKEKAEQLTGKKFNATILNQYSSGNDSINWHQDDETFLQHAIVASYSIGAERPFRAKIGKKISKNLQIFLKEVLDGKVHEVSMKSGSLGILINGVEHCVPKKKMDEIRYNITFRCLGKVEGFGNYYHYNRGAKYQLEDKKSEE